MSTFRLYFRALFGTFFLKFSYNKILMGKKILVPHYYIQTLHKDLFLPLESHSKKTLRKNVPKSARKYKRNVLMPPGHPIILLKSN